jgi:predicted acetyltransferase
MHIVSLAPTVELQVAFLALLADFEINDPSNAEFYAEANTDFNAYVRGLLNEERGLNLRVGSVPCTHRWLVNSSGSVVGITRLRHNINTQFLADSAGHIGFDVAPSHRGKGYGHAVLRAALAEAKSIGLQRALLFTGQTNSRCRAVVERHGGELESITYSNFWDEQLCRYWVDV